MQFFRSMIIRVCGEDEQWSFRALRGPSKKASRHLFCDKEIVQKEAKTTIAATATRFDDEIMMTG